MEADTKGSRPSNSSRASVATARKFDFMEMFEKAHSVAKERNFTRNTEALTGRSARHTHRYIIFLKPSSDYLTASESNDEKLSVDKNKEQPVEKTQDDEDAEVPQPATTDNYDNRDPYFLPITNNLALSHGTKPLTALGVDPAGARVATGGLDFDVKLWDFGGMDSACRPFKIIRPCEEHQTKNLEFSPSGKRSRSMQVGSSRLWR